MGHICTTTVGNANVAIAVLTAIGHVDTVPDFGVDFIPTGVLSTDGTTSTLFS